MWGPGAARSPSTNTTTSAKQAMQPAGQSGTQLLYPLLHPLRPPVPSIPTSPSDTLCLCPSPSQPFNHSAALPLLISSMQTSFSCPRMQCSDVPANALRLSLF
ncbi:hypothetical protein PAMA_010793 [Pampus argenteus]